MAMTLEQAMTFRLPNGKLVSEASDEDWFKVVALYDEEIERTAALDKAILTEEELRHMRAVQEYGRRLAAAADVVDDYHRRYGCRPARH